MRPTPRNNQQNYSQENENHIKIQSQSTRQSHRQNRTRGNKSFRQDYSHYGYHSKLQHLLFKTAIGSITWVVYHICRFCVFGQFKYDAKAQRLIAEPRSRVVRRIALCVKVWLMIMDFASYFMMILYFAIHFVPIEHAQRIRIHTYNMVSIEVPIALALWLNACLLLMAHSPEYSSRIVFVVNELIKLNRSICENFGATACRCDLHILVVFLIKLMLTGVQLYNYHFEEPYCITYHIALFELWYCAYFAYQLLLLAWLSAFVAFIEAYLERLQVQGAPTRRLAKQILRFYELYTRLSQVHRSVLQLWLPVAGMLFTSVWTLSNEGAETLYLIIYDHEKSQLSKWQWILHSALGACLAPLVKMLLLGLCNDRLAQLEFLIRLQVIRVEFWHPKMTSVARFVQLVSYQNTCLGLQQYVHPIRNHIWHIGQTCSRQFVLVFVWYTLANTMSNVQYNLSDLAFK